MNESLLSFLTTVWNVMLIVAGFGLVIVVHELGHFLAAKWAGIRVHAFAVGFGKAAVSWRHGLGLRWGSSEPEYMAMLAASPGVPGGVVQGVSPTEYRLNWFPFGGYVKMLGQEDLHPEATSAAPDSYGVKPVWKRMVVISAGVVMNLILAAVLFMAAYKSGIMEPAPVVGDVAPGSPAERAGLRAGDRLVSIDGERAWSFQDLALAAAMSREGREIEIVVNRPGEAAPVTVKPVAERGPVGLLQIGAGLAVSSTLFDDKGLNEKERAMQREIFDRLGLGGVAPGMRLKAVNGAPVADDAAPEGDPRSYSLAWPLQAAMERAAGAPVKAAFAGSAGEQAVVELRAEARLDEATMAMPDGSKRTLPHLLGFSPLLSIGSLEDRAREQGLEIGDTMARVGGLAWPDVASAIAEVKRNAGGTLALSVLRGGKTIEMTVKVGRDGRIGFGVSDGISAPAVVAPLPEEAAAVGVEAGAREWPARRMVPSVPAGSVVRSVAGTPVATFGDIRVALERATAEAFKAGAGAAPEIEIELPLASASGPARETITLELDAADVKHLHGLGWSAERVMAAFVPAEFLDRASGPMDAVAKGVRKTHQIMLTTYVTFARLVQRSVPVDQLHGPVGIAHVGSRVAERGFVYVIFFLGLISANLAVVNFLPLPIVDGGQFVFLAIEGLTKRPVSAAVQNAATLAGIVLIGTMFLVVTFNDIVRLFG